MHLFFYHLIIFDENYKKDFYAASAFGHRNLKSRCGVFKPS